MQLLITELGHEVRNLGPCVPDEQMVRAAAGAPCDLIVMSTVNGHGLVDGERAVRRLRAEPALRDTPIVIGGKLGVAGTSRPEEVQSLLDAGFTAVFGDDEVDTALFGSYLDSVAARVSR